MSQNFLELKKRKRRILYAFFLCHFKVSTDNYYDYKNGDTAALFQLIYMYFKNIRINYKSMFDILTIDSEIEPEIIFYDNFHENKYITFHHSWKKKTDLSE